MYRFDVDEASGICFLDEGTQKFLLFIHFQMLTMSAASLLFEEGLLSFFGKGHPDTSHRAGTQADDTGDIGGRELLQQMKSDALHTLYLSLGLGACHPVLKQFGGDGRHE